MHTEQDYTGILFEVPCTPDVVLKQWEAVLKILRNVPFCPVDKDAKQTLFLVNDVIVETMLDPAVISRLRPESSKTHIQAFVREWQEMTCQLGYFSVNVFDMKSESSHQMLDDLEEALHGVYFVPEYKSPYCVWKKTEAIQGFMIDGIQIGAIIILGLGFVYEALGIFIGTVVMSIISNVFKIKVKVPVRSYYARVNQSRYDLRSNLSGSVSSRSGSMNALRAPPTESRDVHIESYELYAPDHAIPSTEISVDIPEPLKSRISASSIPRDGVLMFNVGDKDEKILSVDALALHEHVMLVGLRDNLTIALWNHGAELLTGFDMAACLDSNVLGLLDEECQERFLEATSTGSSVSLPITMVHAKKGATSLLAHIVPSTFDGVQTGLVIIAHSHSSSPEAASNLFRLQITGSALSTAQAVYTRANEINDVVTGQNTSLLIRMLNILNPHNTADIVTKWISFSAINVRQFIGTLSSLHVKVKIECDVADDVPEFFRWDTEKLSEILRYLIRNSIKHGATSLTLRCRITHHTKDSIAGIMFEVVDNGSGMDASVLNNLVSAGAFSLCLSATVFHQRTARRRSVQVTKLAMVTETLEALGGSLCCSSVVGEGTVMTVKLPYIPAQGLQDGKTEEALETSLAVSERLDVVLLESNSVYRTNLTQLCWHRGHSVCVAVDFGDLCTIVESSRVQVLFVDTYFLPPQEIPEILTQHTQQITICFLCDHVSEYEDLLEKGFFLCARPICVSDLKTILDKASIRIQQDKERQAQIAKVRSIFTEHNSCTWEKVKKLGSGAFGDVYQARNTTTGGTMAVKVIKISAEDRDAEQKVQDLVNEVALLRQLEHDNIIHYLYCEPGQGCINVFMEFANGGTVSGVIEQKGALSVAKAAGYTRELLKAVAYLHENHIMHRDIKCANLLLSDGKLKLGDFGTAHRLTETPCTEMKGTLRFMAPEVCKEEPHDYSCDIWSIGCTVMEMLTGMQPLPHIEGNYLQVIAQLSSMTNDTKIPIPASIKGHARNFIDECLCVNAALRPTAKTLLTHPFLTHTEVTERKKSAFQDAGKSRLKKAVSKLRVLTKAGILKNKMSSNNLAVEDEEAAPLHRYNTEYFDRKFSGWGDDSVSVAGPEKEDDARKFSGWGGGDDEDSQKRNSVWVAYYDV